MQSAQHVAQNLDNLYGVNSSWALFIGFYIFYGLLSIWLERVYKFRIVTNT